jgi:hypothetical protein
MDRKNPLLFRTDGALDFGPALLAIVAALACVLLVADAFGYARVSVAAWAFLGTFCALAFIAGAAAERAYWIAKSKTPGEVAKGIAESARGGSSQPNLWRDNETGDVIPARDYRGRRG